jgi:hypothetical protein
MPPLRVLPSTLLAFCLGGAAFAHAAPAAAAPNGLFGPDTVSALVDFRLAAADGERAWTDGGFGKARFGQGPGSSGLSAVPAEAELIWQPHLGWNLTGTVVAGFQTDQEHDFDVVEAFVSYRPLPSGPTRLSARAGLLWPAISLEHEGAAWSVADMITPSAINAWVGEEVKVVGLEASASRAIGGGRFSATLGVFGFNDTAGTLLSFRGWALHDEKATAFGKLELPPLNAFLSGPSKSGNSPRQAARTRPAIEIDGRPGFYGKLSWQVAAPLTVEAFYYDNRGDPEAVSDFRQWGWDTRFVNFGARVDLDARTRFLAQYLTGRTEMGPEDASGRYWVETAYRSGYARLSHERGPVTLSGRLDAFDTNETGCKMSADESERGWAMTGDVAWRASQRLELLVELLRIDSERGARHRTGLAAEQTQTVAQAALRVTL